MTEDRADLGKTSRGRADEGDAEGSGFHGHEPEALLA
jgi:hypothetical protein